MLIKNADFGSTKHTPATEQNSCIKTPQTWWCMHIRGSLRQPCWCIYTLTGSKWTYREESHVAVRPCISAGADSQVQKSLDNPAGKRIYCWHNYGVKQETEQGMSSEVWFLGFLLCLSYLSIAGIKIPWPPGQGAWQQPRCRRVSGAFIHICSTSERQRGLIWNGVDFWTSKPHSSHRSPPTSPCLLILPKLLHQLRTMCSNTWAHCGAGAHSHSNNHTLLHHVWWS